MAKNAPIIAPMIIPIPTSSILILLFAKSVVTIAISIPKDAIELPLLAVFGWLSLFIPKMKSTDDKTYSAFSIFILNYFFLNIFNILSVTIKPPTTFTVAKITAAKPSQDPTSPPIFVEIIAPTIAIPDIAFEPLIKGV